MLIGHVDQHYTYGMERQLLQKNIIPVCIDRIFPDGVTFPPGWDGSVVAGKPAGCPRTKRIRARSKFKLDPSKSPIVCSRCGQAGHNVRTCVLRESLATEDGRKVQAEGKVPKVQAEGSIQPERKTRKRRLEQVNELDLS